MAPLEGGLYDGYGAIDAVGPVVALGAYEGKAPPEKPTAYTLPKLVDLQPVRGSPERGRNETLDVAVP